MRATVRSAFSGGTTPVSALQSSATSMKVLV